jgi:hypothetical protein
MNPNVSRLLKTSGIVILTVLFLFLLYFLIEHYTSIRISSVLTNAYYVFIGLLIAGMFVLILGVVLRMIWPAVINRSENITLCCPDAGTEGFHLIGTRYNPGGKFTKGYLSLSHYYITTDGRLFLSRKLSQTQQATSLEDLQRQVQKSLAFDLGQQVVIGYYQDNLNQAKQLSAKGVQLEVRGFETWVDYGFKISIIKSGKVIWNQKV